MRVKVAPREWGPGAVILDLGGKYSRRVRYTLELLGDAVYAHDDSCDLRTLCAGTLIAEPGELVNCTCGHE